MGKEGGKCKSFNGPPEILGSLAIRLARHDKSGGEGEHY